MSDDSQPITDDHRVICLATCLRLIGRVATSEYDDALRGLGIKATQLSLLFAIHATPGVSPGRLASALRYDRSTVSRNLDRLLSSGYVEAHGGGDARSLELRLTSSGRELMEAALPAWREAQGRTEELLGPETTRRVLDAAHRMMVNKSDHETE